MISASSKWSEASQSCLRRIQSAVMSKVHQIIHKLRDLSISKGALRLWCSTDRNLKLNMIDQETTWLIRSMPSELLDSQIYHLSLSRTPLWKLNISTTAAVDLTKLASPLCVCEMARKKSTRKSMNSMRKATKSSNRQTHNLSRPWISTRTISLQYKLLRTRKIMRHQDLPLYWIRGQSWTRTKSPSKPSSKTGSIPSTLISIITKGYTLVERICSNSYNQVPSVPILLG